MMRLDLTFFALALILLILARFLLKKTLKLLQNVFFLVYKDRNVLDNIRSAQIAHVLMKTKLYEMDLVLLYDWREKSQLIACFVLKQHGFFALSNIYEV